MKLLRAILVAVVLTLTTGAVIHSDPVQATTTHTLFVNGTGYGHTSVNSGTIHWYTPTPTPLVARYGLVFWTGNGSEHLFDCLGKGGIDLVHWVYTKNSRKLVLSHVECNKNTPPTTVPPTTVPPTTAPPTTVPPTTAPPTTTLPPVTTTLPPTTTTEVPVTTTSPPTTVVETTTTTTEVPATTLPPTTTEPPYYPPVTTPPPPATEPPVVTEPPETTVEVTEPPVPTSPPSTGVAPSNSPPPALPSTGLSGSGIALIGALLILFGAATVLLTRRSL